MIGVRGPVYRALGGAGLLILIDQLTKLLVKGMALPGGAVLFRGMRLGESIPLLGSWFNLTYVENPHMAFSLEFGSTFFLSLFAFLASLGILWYLFRHPALHTGIRFGLACIMAGALGNMIDRVFYGYWFHDLPLFTGNVVDFVDIDLGTLTFAGSTFKVWPVFNVADIAVSCGVILLLLFNRHLPGSKGALPDATEPSPESKDQNPEGKEPRSMEIPSSKSHE